MEETVKTVANLVLEFCEVFLWIAKEVFKSRYDVVDVSY